MWCQLPMVTLLHFHFILVSVQFMRFVEFFSETTYLVASSFSHILPVLKLSKPHICYPEGLNIGITLYIYIYIYILYIYIYIYISLFLSVNGAGDASIFKNLFHSLETHFHVCYFS